MQCSGVQQQKVSSELLDSVFPASSCSRGASSITSVTEIMDVYGLQRMD